MAKPVQIPIEVVDKFSRQFSDMEKGLDRIGKSAERQQTAFNLLAADVILRYGKQALGAVVDFGRESVRAFEQQESANKRLQIAMQNLGVFTQAAYERQLRFADALEATTNVQGEDIVQAQALLTTFGLYGKQLDRTTKSVVDLAKAQDIDLRTAAMLLGKAFVGETGTLSRYGLQISDTGTRAERFEQVLGQVNRRFGGTAAADLDTHAGKVTALAIAYDNLKKKVGADLVTASDGATVATAGLVASIDRNYASIKKVTFGLGTLGELLADPSSALSALIGRWQAVEAAGERAYQAGNRALAAATGTQPGAPAPTVDNDALALDRKLADEGQLEEFALAEQARMKIERATMTNSQLEDMESEHLARELELNGQFETAEDVREARRLEKEKAFNAQRFQNFKSTLNTIATLATSKNKVLAGIGKAAAISQATIDTFVAANVALKSAPPPFNFALAALVTAAGVANVTKIAGVELAEGGLVRARQGGIQATIGEGGRDEAVIPLDDPRTRQRLAGALGGGGGLTLGDINIKIDLRADGDGRNIARQLAEELRSATADAIEAALLSTRLAGLNSVRAA